MKVIPLTLQNVNWPQFIKMCQDVLDISPTRGLDDAGIDIENPAAFLGCLDFNNDPKKCIRNSHQIGNILDMVHYSFAVELTEEWVISEIGANTPLHIHASINKRKHIMILAGTLTEWKLAIQRIRAGSTSGVAIRILDEIRDHFTMVGLREVFND